MSKKKTAKPSGSDKRQKGLFIRARVTADEKAEIIARAERAGVTEGAYVRAQCLADPKLRAVRRPGIDTKALARLLGELGKVGSNLNQIARLANREGRIDAPELGGALAEVRGLVSVVMQTMGRKGGA